jgi:hypothetical protein
VAQDESAAQHRVQAAFHAHTVPQVHAALATFAADQRHVAARLSALTPPADAVAANRQLAHAFDDNAAAVRSVLRKISGVSSVRQALGVIQSDKRAQRVGQEIDAALGKLKKLGYTPGS